MKRLLAVVTVSALAWGCALTPVLLSVSAAPAATPRVQAAVTTPTTPAASPTPGGFTSLAPSVLLDTRLGVGAPQVAVASRGVVQLQVSGRGGVPDSGVASVALNVNVSSATSSGYLAAYENGATLDAASHLSFAGLVTVSHVVIVPVGSDGKVALYNGSAGTIHLIANVAGYYRSGAPTAAGAFGSLAPARVLDTAAGVGAAQGMVASHGVVHLQVTGRGGVPDSGVRAVVLNVKVAGPTHSGYLTVYADGATRQPAPNLSFWRLRETSRLVVAQVSSDGKVALYNGSAGTLQLVAEVSGYYRSGAPTVNGTFGSLAPFRLLDTVAGTGATRTPVAPRGVVNLQVTRRGGVPTTGVSAVALNVTVASPTRSGYLTVYDGVSARQSVPSLSFVRLQNTSSPVIARVGSDGKVALYNGSAGTVQLSADIVGYFNSGTEPRTILPTLSTLTSSSTTTTYDTALALTASVAGDLGTATGEVNFTDASNGSMLAGVSLSRGAARLRTAALAPGSRSIIVTYSGDQVYAASVSDPVAITIKRPLKTVAPAFQNNSGHDGMDSGDTFNPATLHKAWSTNLNPTSGSATVSYPLIVGAQIFVAVGNSKAGGNAFYALNAHTGAVNWYTLVSSTYPWIGITYDGGQVFVQNSAGTLTAYNAATGHINWSTAPGQRSFSAPPTAYNGVLYATGAGSGGTLFAISEANGAVAWSAAVANGDVSSPAVDDSGVYEDYAGDLAYGFGLNGVLRWTNDHGISGGGGATSVLNGGHLYLRGGNTGSGASIVSAATGVSSGTFGGTMLPAFDAANMYFVSGGRLQAVDKTGSPARWTFNGDGSIDATPVTTNGIVFTGSSTDRLYGINSRTGAQVWTAVAPGAVSTTDTFAMHKGLAAAGGMLAVPAGGFLTVYTN